MLLSFLLLASCSTPVSMPSKTPIDDAHLNTSTTPDYAIETSDIQKIIGVWAISYAVEKETGKDFSLQNFYGTGIQYGGRLIFNEDGTFSKYIGITDGDVDSHEGKYSFSDYSILLEYYDGNVENAEYIADTDEIMLQQEEYITKNTVYEYFVRNVQTWQDDKGLTYDEIVAICIEYFGENGDIEGHQGWPYVFLCAEYSFPGEDVIIEREGKEYYIVRISWIVNADRPEESYPSYAGHAFVSIDGNEIYDGIKHSDGTYSFGRLLNADPDIYTEYS